MRLTDSPCRDRHPCLSDIGSDTTISLASSDAVVGGVPGGGEAVAMHLTLADVRSTCRRLSCFTWSTEDETPLRCVAMHYVATCSCAEVDRSEHTDRQYEISPVSDLMQAYRLSAAKEKFSYIILFAILFVGNRNSLHVSRELYT